jgi:hypothetical protein
MVYTKSRKTIDKVTNAKGLVGCVETGQLDAVQIPLWVYKSILSGDWDVPLTFDQLDTGKKRPPLQIPSWLFKNLLREDRDVPLTVKQVACLLEVNPKTVKRWINLGLLRRHSASPHGRLMFLIADVVEALVNKPKLQRLFDRKGTGWGRMSIVDTKPFMLPLARHNIIINKPPAPGIPA